MDIDFTKKYYRKEDIIDHIFLSHPLRKKRKIVNSETKYGLEDYSSPTYNLDELVCEDDFDKFVDSIIKEKQKKADKIKSENQEY